MSSCIKCSKLILPRRQAVTCNRCLGQQHRACDTGIDASKFTKLRRLGIPIPFVCQYCKSLDFQFPTESDTSELIVQLRTDQTAADESTFLYDECVPRYQPEPSLNYADLTFGEPPVLELSVPHPMSTDDTEPIDEPPSLEPIDNPLESTRAAPNSELNFTVNSSFNLTVDHIEQPPVLLEDSIEDAPPAEGPADTDIQFLIEETGSTRLKKKLTDSRGYQYTVKRVRENGTTDWWCAVRSKKHRCPATVLQTQSTFKMGRHSHNHESNPGVGRCVKIVTESKTTSEKNPFQSAQAIIESVMTKYADSQAPPGSRPNIANLQRAVNRHRQKSRPKDPQDLDFEINYDFLPENFVRKDVRVDSQRHIILATDRQLQILATAKIWYLDATFKIIRKPFEQLLSIHAFLRSGNDTKQVPLVYVMMSSRRKKDYKKVLKKIRKLLPSTEVEEFVVDFEAAIWGAVRSRFPGSRIKGCAFHWSQAIWRHVQSLGLQPQYRERDSVYKYVRSVMALCFLPAEHTRPVFNKLRDRLNPDESPKLQQLMTYVQSTWFENSVWGVENWSVYMRPTRTNNDVEGWHNRLNKKATHLGVYRLIPLLKEESDLLPLQTKLVSEGKLKKTQRKNTTSIQASLFNAWERF